MIARDRVIAAIARERPSPVRLRLRCITPTGFGVGFPHFPRLSAWATLGSRLRRSRAFQVSTLLKIQKPECAKDSDTSEQHLDRFLIYRDRMTVNFRTKENARSFRVSATRTPLRMTSYPDFLTLRLLYDNVNFFGFGVYWRSTCRRGESKFRNLGPEFCAALASQEAPNAAGVSGPSKPTTGDTDGTDLHRFFKQEA